MNTISFLKKYLFALSAVFIVSCDTDFNELDTDIIDDDIHSNMLRHEARVTAYDKATGAVQANNLPVNSLGVYENPVFGKTVAHFVTQLQLDAVNPTFVTPVIDSVYLYVPYYSTAVNTNDDGSTNYTFDSIYGNVDAKFRLSVYENRFFLRDSDPGSTAGQRYYSDDKVLIENNRGTVLLNDAEDITQNAEFGFKVSEVQRKYTDANDEEQIIERLAPGMFLELNKDFFQNKILNAGAGNLINNNVFKDYFRGIYFNVEQIGNQSVMAMARFGEGVITIRYTDDKLDPSGNPVYEDGSIVRETKTLTLNLSGNTINFFENTYNSTFNDALAITDEAAGDDRLYIKGGEGSMAVLDILNDADLELLKYNPETGEKALINEANLSFYIDKDAMASTPEPVRIYLYDLDNRRPLFDYYADNSTNAGDAKYDKFIHGGIIERESDGRGLRYKIRITDHINNIMNRDSTNVRLGLVVTENINSIGTAALKTPFTTGETEVKNVPVSSVIHPFGTVLYGSNTNVPVEKRLKLEIYYTKPN